MGNIIRYQVPLWHWTVSLQPIFHLLGKTYCWSNPASAPRPARALPPSLSHVTKWPSFALPCLYSTGEWIFNVRTGYLPRWPLKYSKKISTKHGINISARPSNGMYPRGPGNPIKEEPSLSTRWFKHPHAQMQAHNMHLYELLRRVYSGSMEHRDLKGLSKGTGHIVTFSWDRAAPIGDEWQMRVQRRMCLMQREQA